MIDNKKILVLFLMGINQAINGSQIASTIDDRTIDRQGLQELLQTKQLWPITSVNFETRVYDQDGVEELKNVLFASEESLPDALAIFDQKRVNPQILFDPNENVFKTGPFNLLRVQLIENPHILKALVARGLLTIKKGIVADVTRLVPDLLPTLIQHYITQYSTAGFASFVSETHNGFTALHAANDAPFSEKKFIGCIEILLKCKADPNIHDALDRTPLHVATYHGRVATVELLIAAKADVNAERNYPKATKGTVLDLVLKDLAIENRQLLKEIFIKNGGKTAAQLQEQKGT